MGRCRALAPGMGSFDVGTEDYAVVKVAPRVIQGKLTLRASSCQPALTGPAKGETVTIPAYAFGCIADR